MVQRFDDSHIVVHLDRIMLERGVSLTELSGRVGITQANLSKIRHIGTKVIDLDSGLPLWQ